MGISDTTTYELTCKTCAKVETQKVFDYGSGWRGPSWRPGADFEGFTTRWTGGGKTEPVLEEAQCKTCLNAANVRSR